MPNRHRDFRIRTQNLKVLEILKEKGFEAYLSKCKPKTNWGTGCNDPSCCEQHPDALIYEENGKLYAKMPDYWTAITTSASSNQIYRALQELHEISEEIS